MEIHRPLKSKPEHIPQQLEGRSAQGTNCLGSSLIWNNQSWVKTGDLWTFQFPSEKKNVPGAIFMELLLWILGGVEDLL